MEEQRRGTGGRARGRDKIILSRAQARLSTGLGTIHNFCNAQ